jgi:cation diffusion facilitator CzcD-associated flavoprotein CzcO
VIGAGPYGLAVASHLRDAGFAARVFGKAMDFWDRQMPVGMCLRSPREGTHISDPRRAWGLDAFEATEGAPLKMPLPLETFVRYGRWFQQQALPDVDPRQVARVERPGPYRLTLEDGERVEAEAVVVAAGIGTFGKVPAPFAGLPPDRVSHSSDRANRDLGRFAGRRVVVVGGGQSAIESAALLREGGAEVEVLVRQPRLRWLRYGTPLHDWLHSKSNPLRPMLFPPGNIGAPGVNWLIEKPPLFQRLPRGWRDRLAAWAIRPAASGWLRPRTQGVPIRTGRHVVAAEARGGGVALTLSDGTEITADHVLLGTGYQVDVSRYWFLAPEVLAAVRTVGGYPVLNAGFESTAAGLYFVGAPAAHSFGPICRFVAGTPFAAHTLTRLAKARPPGR